MKKILLSIISFLALIPLLTSAQLGGCLDYGPFAMEDYLTNKCKCMSGYVFSTDITGNPYCVSADTICHDKYGYNSRYDSLNESCKCSYGYVFGKDSIGRTKCVSPDSVCTDQLGYNASYDSISDTCKCRYGYVISGGSCVDGDTVCHSRNGLYSSYNESEKSCECDSGYTLDASNQCVKKQNNVYFFVKELDTDNREAIIRSDYDSRYYRITYSSGCYSSSFNRYLGRQIVVNLGTDYDLDSWDKIVLQNDDETCDIRSRERVDSSTTLKEESADDYYVVPATNYNYVPVNNPPVVRAQVQNTPPKEIKKETVTAKKEIPVNISKGSTTIATTTKIVSSTSTVSIKRDSLSSKIKSFFRRFFW